MKKLTDWLEEKIKLYKELRDGEAKERDEPKNKGLEHHFERVMAIYDAKYGAYKELLELIRVGAVGTSEEE